MQEMMKINKLEQEFKDYKESLDIDFKTIYKLMANQAERIGNQQMQIENLLKMLDIVKGVAENGL